MALIERLIQESASLSDTLKTSATLRVTDVVAVDDVAFWAKTRASGLKQYLFVDHVDTADTVAAVKSTAGVVASPFSMTIFPAFRQGGVAQNGEVVIEISAALPINMATMRIRLDGNLAFSAGSFRPYYAGASGVGSTPNSKKITITTHPLFQHREADVLVVFNDTDGVEHVLTSTFLVEMPSITELTARSAPDGGAVRIAWKALPAGVASVVIKRSASAYQTYIDDPGDTVTTITGPVLTAFEYVDTVKAGIYYYSLFLSFVGTGLGLTVFPYTDSACRVGGLSLIDYQAQKPDYLYNLFPADYRKRDGSEALGSDRYQLKKLCRALQAGTNVMRGQISLLDNRDPDTMPLGRIGVASNQLGMITARCVDLGFAPDQGFDAGVLRRVALGIVDVFRKKGTCAGLEQFVKMTTTWDARCEELIEPRCGVLRLLSFWDGESKLLKLTGRMQSPNFNPTSPEITQPAAGSLSVLKSAFKDMLGASVAAPPLYSTGATTVSNVMTKLGDFACVSNISDDPADTANRMLVTFEDPTAYLRNEILITVTSAQAISGTVKRLTVTGLATTTWPWQFPSPDTSPLINDNAWNGLKLMDSAGAVFPVVGTIGTSLSSGLTYVDVTAAGAVAVGTASVSEDFDTPTNFAARKPRVTLKFTVGELAFTYDPAFDARLLRVNEIGPVAVFPNIGALNGAGNSQFAGGPEAVVMWLS